MRLFNNIDVAENGIGVHELKTMGIKSWEIWTTEELEAISSLDESLLVYVCSDASLEDNESLLALRSLIMRKRAVHSLVEGRFFAIPSNASLSMSYSLMLLGMSLLVADTSEKWKGILKGLRVDLAKIVFSKECKKLYNRKVSGFSGVALTHGGSVDEILVPSWTGLRMGELCAVVRHPVQNVFLVCRVSGYTDNEFRISPWSWRLVDGDFDGDEINIIPLYQFGKSVVSAGSRLFPSKIYDSVEFGELMEQYK